VACGTERIEMTRRGREGGWAALIYTGGRAVRGRHVGQGRPAMGQKRPDFFPAYFDLERGSTQADERMYSMPCRPLSPVPAFNNGKEEEGCSLLLPAWPPGRSLKSRCLFAIAVSVRIRSRLAVVANFFYIKK
jgi:hypothetical protein